MPFERHGHNSEAWLTDVPERLPGMTDQHDLTILLPSNWQPATAANKPLRETCPASDSELRRKHTYLCMLPTD